MKRMPTARIAPRPKATRQPRLTASVFSSRTVSPAATAVPIHHELLIASATRPRTRAGTSSSIAELIAEYSPPMPLPASTRKSMNDQKFQASAVATVKSR